MFCLLSTRCTIVGLRFEGFEMAMQWGWVFFRELFAIFSCAVSKYLSIQEEVRLMGKFA